MCSQVDFETQSNNKGDSTSHVHLGNSDMFEIEYMSLSGKELIVRAFKKTKWQNLSKQIKTILRHKQTFY